jgi:hypothetical protein
MFTNIAQFIIYLVAFQLCYFIQLSAYFFSFIDCFSCVLRYAACPYLGFFYTSNSRPSFVPSSSPKPTVTFEWITGENNTLQLWDIRGAQPNGNSGEQCVVQCNDWWMDTSCNLPYLIICETQAISECKEKEDMF